MVFRAELENKAQTSPNMVKDLIFIKNPIFLMKFDFFDNSDTFLVCAPDLNIRLSSRAGAVKKMKLAKVWTNAHVSGFLVPGGSLQVVSASGVEIVVFVEN